MAVLRANYPRLFREFRRPTGFFAGIGDHTLFYGRALAGRLTQASSRAAHSSRGAKTFER